MNDQLVFSSSIVELSEEQDYLSLRNKICYFNSENLNMVQLDYDDSTVEHCQSLINSPVCAKYVKRDGKDDLGGHEIKVVDGKVKFGTATIGVVTGIDIKEEDVKTTSGEVRNLPVLYADERIWTRNENATKAIKRLYSEGKLFSSWELKSSEYTYSNGVKHITGYEFIGNCLLGTKSFPAYGKDGASVVEMSEQSGDYAYFAAEAILSEALALDIESMPALDINSNSEREEEKEIMDVNEAILESEVDENAVEEPVSEETANTEAQEEITNQPEVSEDSEQEERESEAEAEGESEEVSETVEEENSEAEEETSEEVEESSEGNNENSAMKTDADVYKMICKAVQELEKDEWYYISMIFPEDKFVLIQCYGMSSLEFLKYSYRIDGDKAILENEEKVELVISPLQINSEIEKKNNALAEANDRITELENQNAELIKAKEELDRINAEKAETEHAKRVDALRNYVVKSGRFTEAEIASEKLISAIENLDETWIKSEIADRLVASFANEKKSENVETSETNLGVSVVLSEDKSVTPEDVMKAFFND